MPASTSMGLFLIMMIRCCLLEVLVRIRYQQRPDFIYKFLDISEGICFYAFYILYLNHLIRLSISCAVYGESNLGM